MTQRIAKPYARHAMRKKRPARTQTRWVFATSKEILFHPTTTTTNLAMSKSLSDKICDFIEEYCKFPNEDWEPDGPDIPQYKPMVLSPYQRRFIALLYEVDAEGNLIRSRGLLVIPKKNGKTGFVAALGLVHLCGPMAVRGSRLTSAAGSREQASLIYDAMKQMLLADPRFDAHIVRERGASHNKDCRMTIYTGGTNKKIRHNELDIEYTPIPAKAETTQGVVPRFWAYDELAQARNLRLYDALSRAQGTMKNAIGIVLSSNSDIPGNPLEEVVSLSEGLGHWVRMVYVAPDDADIFDWETVKKCNPAMGWHLRPEQIEREIEEARVSDVMRSAFRSYRLNQTVAAINRLIDREKWERIADGNMALPAAGRECYGGLDLSGSRDLTAFVLYFPATLTECGQVRLWAWLPAEVVDNSRNDRGAPYRTWVENGHLQACAGETIDDEMVIARIMDCSERWKIKVIGYDRWRVKMLLGQAEKLGVQLPEMLEHGQGFRDMGISIDIFEKLFHDRGFKHPNNPVLNWCMYNAGVLIDPAENRKIVRPAAAAKIDAAVALIQAVGVKGRDKSAPKTLIARGLYD